MIRPRHLEKIKEDLRSFHAKRLARGDINKISNQINVDQSQVGRILRCDFKTLSPNVIKVCKYANIQTVISISKRDARSSQTLIDAINYVWDGSEEAEKLLVCIIKSLKPTLDKGIQLKYQINS